MLSGKQRQCNPAFIRYLDLTNCHKPILSKVFISVNMLFGNYSLGQVHSHLCATLKPMARAAARYVIAALLALLSAHTAAPSRHLESPAKIV
jgi:hypothetical protein